MLLGRIILFFRKGSMKYTPKKGTVYTPEIVAFLREHCKKVFSNFELIDLVNERFGISFTNKQIRTCKSMYNITGMKRRNRHRLPLFSECKNDRGYICIKLADTGKHHKAWRKKHIWLWEQANGKVPKNHCIIFLDGDKSNFDLSNLYCLSKRALGYMRLHGYSFSSDPNITKTTIGIIELALKIHERRIELKKGLPPKQIHTPATVDTVYKKGGRWRRRLFIEKTDSGYVIMCESKKGIRPLNSHKYTFAPRKTANEALNDLKSYARAGAYSRET